MSVILVTVPMLVDASGAEEILRVATEDYAPFGSDDFYAGKIIELQSLQREIAEDGSTLGAARMTDGRLVLAALDGALDALDRYGYGGEVEVLVGDSVEDAIGDFTAVLKLVAESASVAREDVQIRLRDRAQELLKSVSPARYDGSNSGVTGLEGTPETLEGKVKCRLFGAKKLIQPHVLNVPAQIIGVNHDRAGNLAAASYDRVTVDTGSGYADWTFGVNHASLSAFNAATPAQGVYDTYSDGGLAKLGGTISSEALDRLFVDVHEGANADARKIAGLIERLLLDAGVASGNIDSAEVTAGLTANDDETGLFVDDEREYPAALNTLAGYGGFFWGAKRLGVYGLKQIVEPAGGTSEATLRRFTLESEPGLNDFDVLDVRPIANRDGAVPIWRATAEGREEVAEDASIKTQFPAREKAFAIEFTSSAAVSDELTRRLNLYKVVRRAFEVDVKLSADAASSLDLGDVVTLFWHRFGLSAGKKLLVTGLSYAVRPEKVITLKVWG